MTLFAPLATPRARAVESPAVPLTSSTLLELVGGSHAAAGVNVTETTALGMPAVWRAVNVIAGTAAGLPLHAYRDVEDTREKLKAPDRAARFLDDPHPDLTPFELWETAYTHVALWGNFYGRKLGSTAMPLAELWPIHPSRVKVGRVSETGRKIYEIDGGLEVHYDDTLLHVPGFGYDGTCGVSPVRAAREGLSLAMAAEQYGAKFFGSGSLATGVLQTEQRLTPRQADALHARWQAKRTGLGSAHDTIVLDRGAKFEQLSIPPEDAQFIETRRFQISEIARMFGIPPHMLMDTEKSTSWGTGIEQQTIGFVTYSLRNWLIRFEQRISKHLLKPQNAYARYSLEGLLRGDSAQRAAFYRTMREIGGLNADEIRALEERGPIPGGDVYLQPGNLVPLGYEPTAQPAPAELAPPETPDQTSAELAQQREEDANA